VDVLLGSDRRLDPFVSPFSPKVAIPSPGPFLEARPELLFVGKNHQIDRR